MKTTALLLALSLIASAAPGAEAIAQSQANQQNQRNQQKEADVTVRVQDGVYHVAATFHVEEPAKIVFGVLTGYDQIPRFMPDVRSSRVIEHNDDHKVVEQEAVAKVMMFSRRVHLVLEVREEPMVIRFRDRCGKSFERYEGAWMLSAPGANGVANGVDVRYELAAKPSFQVPEFLLKRLLRSDAQEMIRRLRDEMTSQARGR